jgi:dTDP-glucose pyrophosphorylase
MEKNPVIGIAARVIDAMRVIDDSGLGACSVVDDRGLFVAVLTDGDVRRGIMNGVHPENLLRTILPTTEPVCGHLGESWEVIHARIRATGVRQLPVIDAQGRPVCMLPSSRKAGSDAEALVMAGGLGRRLMPLTADTPKPLLDVRGMANIDRLLRSIAQSGIQRVYIAVCHMADKIEAAVGDGSVHGIHIDYIREPQPLGTAGALRLVPRPRGKLLIVNGDIDTDLNVERLLEYHDDHQAVFTLGAYRLRTRIPYGVLQVEGSLLVGMAEKPETECLVAAGMYVAGPRTWDVLDSESKTLDMPDLVRILLATRARIAVLPILGRWIDIGTPDDYRRAQEA